MIHSNILVEQYKLFNDNMKLLDIVILTNKIMIYNKIENIGELLDYDSIDISRLEFRYDQNNLRIPYLNNKKINAIKLNDENIHDYISSTSLLSDANIICGEKIQYLCDVVVGNMESLAFNPNNVIYSRIMICLNNLHNLSKYKTIFVFTHDLKDFYDKFKNELSDKIIVSHNSDHEITYVENIMLHLAQNCMVKHKKLVSIPIGIENTQWFNHDIFHKVRKLNIQKTKNIYFFFNLNTHHSRHECFNKLKSKLEWNSKLDKENYFKELASHKYAICPRGNGLDTHRIWECLYLNVIPIVIESDFINIDNLPIIILKDWNQLDNLDKLNSFNSQKISKLTLDYYKDVISYF
jgi:hypothetical protein